MLRKINGLVSNTFTLEQTSGFKLERNKDLTFIVIIIDIDWYENNYRDNFLGHIAQPYSNMICGSGNIRNPITAFMCLQSQTWLALAGYYLFKYLTCCSTLHACLFSICSQLLTFYSFCRNDTKEDVFVHQVILCFICHHNGITIFGGEMFSDCLCVVSRPPLRRTTQGNIFVASGTERLWSLMS